MNHLVQLLAMLSLVFYSRKLERKMRSLHDRIYSARIRGAFYKCGHHFLCEKKIRLCNSQFIQIGNNVHVFCNSILATHTNEQAALHGHIKIGDNVTIGEETHITSVNSIIIGDNVLTGRRCTITDNSHGRSTIEDITISPIKRKVVSKGPVVIGNNVWLGDNVIVLPGVTIGEGSIVGASSVVTKSAPPRSVLVGNPARIIKKIE